MDIKKRIIPLFLVLIMIGSSVLYFINKGPTNNVNEDYFYNIRGEQVNESINSIEDGLRLTPSNATMAYYINVSKIRGTVLEQAFKKEIQKHNQHYQSQTTMIYKAQFNGTWVEMNDIQPRQLGYDARVYEIYSGYFIIFKSIDTPLNVMGVPILYGPSEGIKQTIDVIEGNATTNSYEKYEDLLSMAGQDDYQSVAQDLRSADKAYIGITVTNPTQATRTIIYQNPTNETLNMINDLESSAEDRGLTYTVSTQDNYTIVEVSGPINQVITEQFEPTPANNTTNETANETGNETGNETNVTQ